MTQILESVDKNFKTAIMHILKDNINITKEIDENVRRHKKDSTKSLTLKWQYMKWNILNVCKSRLEISEQTVSELRHNAIYYPN